MGVLAYIKSVEISSPFISGGVPDMIYPITNYALLRLIPGLEKPSIKLAVAIVSIATVGEIAQYMELYPGTFDAKDIPMYFVGAGLAYGIDRVTYNKQKALEEKVV